MNGYQTKIEIDYLKEQVGILSDALASFEGGADAIKKASNARLEAKQKAEEEVHKLRTKQAVDPRLKG